ncbi:MAG: hypothetical protein AB1861_11890 [Cyanobacteriota bacterium]
MGFCPLDISEEFDNGFYDNLRSLVNDNALMLMVASRKELSVCVSIGLSMLVFQPGPRSQAGRTDYRWGDSTGILAC